MTKIIICPDSFKGTFPARQAAAAIASGAREVGADAVEVPLADGGEGTLEALLAGGGERRTLPVRGPLGDEAIADYGLLQGGTVGIVEMARASGLHLVEESARDAWRASTYGTGQLIVAAAGEGVERILVSVGGSATTDGGAGALAAIAEAGADLPPLTVLCDVQTRWEDSPRIFGPQKGADRQMVERLSQRLEALAGTLPRDPRGVPMTGCAGGLSGALWAAHGAELVSGADFILDQVGFDRLLVDADLVVTGEGRLDEQSLEGKVVGVVAARCRRGGVRCTAVVGRSQLPRQRAAAAGLGMVVEASTLAELREAGTAVAEAAREASA
jgi:glycerate kinase